MDPHLYPFKALPTVLLAMLGLQISAVGGSSFHLYAPSPTANQLWILFAKPRGSELKLSVESKVDVGFEARTIAAHPTKPILYLGSGRGATDKVNAAAVFLDADGGYSARRPFLMKHGTAYLSTDREGRFLLSADYESGAVDVYAIDSGGFPTRWRAGRDEGRKFAHCVLPSPDDRFVYIPYVKDSNALLQYRFAAKSGSLTPLELKNALPPENTGPRHLAYHPTLPIAYFSNEQHLGISVYNRESNGSLTFRALCEAVAPSESKEGISASDIVITPNGRFIFSGIRGHTRDFNWIARYRVDDRGDVSFLGRVPADKIPWGFALSPDGDYLAVSAFSGGSIVVYRVAEDGDLTEQARIDCDKNISDLIAR